MPVTRFQHGFQHLDILFAVQIVAAFGWHFKTQCAFRQKFFFAQEQISPNGVERTVQGKRLWQGLAWTFVMAVQVGLENALLQLF